MSFSEAFDTCMQQKSMPLPSEIFSERSLTELLHILDQIHNALENAGGTEITLAALAAMGPTLGLSEDALAVLGVLAGAAANVAASVYISSALSCVAVAVAKDRLFSELDQVPDGFAKDQVVAFSEAEVQDDLTA